MFILRNKRELIFWVDVVIGFWFIELWIEVMWLVLY